MSKRSLKWLGVLFVAGWVVAGSAYVFSSSVRDFTNEVVEQVRSPREVELPDGYEHSVELAEAVEASCLSVRVGHPLGPIWSDLKDQLSLSEAQKQQAGPLIRAKSNELCAEEWEYRWMREEAKKEAEQKAREEREPKYACKVLDTLTTGSKEVSCLLEFYYDANCVGNYFEVRFYDADGYQVDYINEIAPVRPGKNTVTVTGYSRPFSSYEVFVNFDC